MKQLIGLAILSVLPLLAFNQNCTSFVDPFIGTENGGNVFVGACVPFGMVKLGPDCNKNHSNSGYESGGVINGFSHTHVSGTGGGAKYGNILFMPYSGADDANQIPSAWDQEKASPGYFSVHLKKHDIKAELTATHSVGFHQYTYPENAEAKIFIDLGHFLISGIGWGEEQFLVGSEIKKINDTVVEGYSRVRGGWNEGEAYTVYFYAVFNKTVVNCTTWKNNLIHKGNAEEFDSGDATGMFLSFGKLHAEKLKVKVAISFLSTGRAKNNLENEINNRDFDATVVKANNAWENLLSEIKVETDNTDQKKVFYTAMYHAFMMPVNRTGENPKWASDEPYYDDFYAIWDTYRSSNSLFTLVVPDVQRDIVRSLIDIYRHDGYMPDARSGNDNGRTQGGSNCDVLIADAYLKGLKGIDYATGLQAMLKDAEVPPGDNERKEGRGGLPDYNTLGYVSTNYERAGSRTVEYAYDDYCIARLAKGLGRDSVAGKYFQKSHNWVNLWNKNIEDKGAKGFIWPRNADGSWQSDFTVTTAGSWNDFFYESHSWEYSFYAPHDMPKLIELCGGNDLFLNRLDTFFRFRTNAKSGRSYQLFNVGNEPGFLTPCLYHWIGRPDKSVDAIRQSVLPKFNSTRGGIPGNDDSGAMSSLLMFHSLGLFPIAGQDIYLITSPLFPSAKIQLADNNKFTVKAKNLTEKNIYVKSAILNGKPLSRAWLKHNEIIQGGELLLEMTDKPGSWGRENLPQSAY